MLSCSSKESPAVRDRLGSPRRRLYPPACRPYGLEAEPEAQRDQVLQDKIKVCIERQTRK
jgi:hypothetical protein